MKKVYFKDDEKYGLIDSSDVNYEYYVGVQINLPRIGLVRYMLIKSGPSAALGLRLIRFYHRNYTGAFLNDLEYSDVQEMLESVRSHPGFRGAFVTKSISDFFNWLNTDLAE